MVCHGHIPLVTDRRVITRLAADFDEGRPGWSPKENGMQIFQTVSLFRLLVPWLRILSPLMILFPKNLGRDFKKLWTLLPQMQIQTHF